MRRVLVKVNNVPAAIFTEEKKGQAYTLEYLSNYQGAAISLTLPCQTEKIHFNHFPAFFDGLLPEGSQLEGLLRNAKIDRQDYFSQLITVGKDMVGAVTVEEIIA